VLFLYDLPDWLLAVSIVGTIAALSPAAYAKPSSEAARRSQ